MNKNNLLSILDLKSDDIEELLQRASFLKERLKDGIPYRPLEGKTVGLIFEKPSTRTRVSFEVGVAQFGGNSVYLTPRDSQLGRGEPVKDTARVFSRYVDGVVIRTFGHNIIEDFASHSSIPVINGLTDLFHPCQVLSDLFSVSEKKGDIKNLKVAWVGDGNNMANSWINAAARLRFSLHIATPEGYEPDKGIVDNALNESADINLHKNPEEAVKGADVVNTDVWVSMGQDGERRERLKAFKGFRLDDGLLKRAKKDCIVLHCLPAHRGEEITDGVMEGGASIVWDQAENRLHMQKAILEWAITK